MSAQLDGLLARSRSPGRFIERRRFTLSRKKAVEKLREFSLRRPEEYILELVQAAVFAGARWIAIDVSKERLFFAWVGGQTLGQDQLEHVFDYLFADRTATSTRHLVQLAVALNALLQRSPKMVRIESGDGSAEGTVRMDLDAQGNGTVGRPEDAFAGTYLVVEYTTSWFSRFDGSSYTQEQGLVEERCLYCPVPILLNYRAPFGYRSNRDIKLFGVDRTRVFAGDGRRGVLGVPGQAAKRDAGIRFVVGGVWITTRPVPELGALKAGDDKPLHLVGVVCDDHLRKTADQGDIVEDARYIEFLHALQPTATELLVSALGPGYRPPRLPPLQTPPAEAGASLGSGPSGGASGAVSSGVAGPLQPAAEPLPNPLPQLAPRPALQLSDLSDLSLGTPLFWADPETAKKLGTAGDPDRFPFRLLVLTPGQAVTLADFRAGLSLAAISNAADAEFVARVALRGARSQDVELPVAATDGLGAAGTLKLHLHLEGRRPDLGAETQDDVPVVVRGSDRVLWCGPIHLGLPHLSVVLQLDSESFDSLAGPDSLGQQIRREAWRLLADLPPGLQLDASAPGAPGAAASRVSQRLRAFTVALLAMSATSFFYRKADASLALALRLPRHWGDQGIALRRVPLAWTDQGPLTLQGWCERLADPNASSSRITLSDVSDLRRLLPLDSVLGGGQLSSPVHDDLPLIVIVCLPNGTWRRWTGEGLAPDHGARALLILGSSVEPHLHLPRWRVYSRPAKGVVVALRDSLRTPESSLAGAAAVSAVAQPAQQPEQQLPASVLEPGLRLLVEELSHAVHRDLWPTMLQRADRSVEATSWAGLDSTQVTERARQVGRLALISLAARMAAAAVDVEDPRPALPVAALARSDGQGWRRLRALSTPDTRSSARSGARSAVRVAPRHGPRLCEVDTVLLSWPELAEIDRAGLDLSLRFDDPPEVWDSLIDHGQVSPTPSLTSDWLLRERLRVPGMEGWLGLRQPYDPTSAVMVQQSGELIALGRAGREVPCHGLAWTLGGTDSVGPVQRDLLELTRLRLYQRLAQILGSPALHPTPAEVQQQAAAQDYATDFAAVAWWRAGGDTRSDTDEGGTAARLLDMLRVEDAQGADLGSLGSWLAQPVDRRPAAAGPAARHQRLVRLARADEDEADPAAHSSAEGATARTLTALGQRLRLALSLAAGDAQLRVSLHALEAGQDDPPVAVLPELSSQGVIGLTLNRDHNLVDLGLGANGDLREILLLEAARVAVIAARAQGLSADLLKVQQLLAAQRL